MLTLTSRYALQALVLIAAEPEEWHDVRRVAEAVGVPANYLSKILGRFRKSGLLDSRKGRGGGFRLVRDPAMVCLEEIVRPFDGADRAPQCAFGLPECSDENPCPLHDHWKRVRELYEEMLSDRTLADMVTAESRLNKRRRRRQAKARRMPQPRKKAAKRIPAKK